MPSSPQEKRAANNAGNGLPSSGQAHAQTLEEISACALQGTELGAVFDRCGQLVCEALHTDLCLALELLPSAHRFVARGGFGFAQEWRSQAIAGPPPHSPGEPALISPPLEIVEDLPAQDPFPAKGLLLQHRMVSGIAAVLKGAVQAFGILETFSHSSRRFTPDDLIFFQTTANVLSSLIQKKTEETALAEARECLEMALRVGSLGTWVWDQKSNLVLRNAGWNRILGLSAVDSTQSIDDFLERIHPEDRAAIAQTYAESLKTQRHEAEYRIVRPDHSIRHVFEQAEVVPEVPTRMVGVVADITEQRRQKEELAWSAAVIGSSEDAIIGLSLDGIIQSWNRAAEGLFGAPREQALGQAISSFYGPECAQNVRNILAKLKREESIQPFEAEERRDGRVILLTTVSPVRSPQGKLIGASAIIRDVTRLREAERALQERAALKQSEGRFRELAETMPELVWTATPEGITDYANNRCFEYTGFTCQRALSQEGFNAALHPADFRQVMQTRDQAMRTGQGTEVEFRLRSKTGEYRWHLCRATPIKGQGNEVVRWIFTCTDIESEKRFTQLLEANAQELERKVAERTEELHQHVQFQQRLLYSIAHHLRTPLRAIDGFSHILLQDHAPALERSGQELTQRILDSANHMDRLIEAVLRLGRLNSGNLPCEHIELGDEIDRVCQHFASQIQSRQAQVHLQETFPTIWANPEAIDEILTHLLSNALKFVPPERVPQVQITAEERPPFVRLWIKDNGVGIPPEYRERVFELFEQFEEPAVYPGSGIGLAIVRTAAERMNGRIGVESEVGKGTAFWIDLPREPREAHHLHREDRFAFLAPNDGLILADASGKVVWTNQAFSRLCGYTLAEVYRKRPGTMLQGPETDPAAIRRMHEALQAEKPVCETVVNYRKNGEGYYIQLLIAPVRRNHQLIGFAAVEREITPPVSQETIEELKRELDRVVGVAGQIELRA